MWNKVVWQHTDVKNLQNSKISNRKQVYVVLGEPINFGKIENPNYDEIGAAHAKYMENLEELFERYKHLYLDSETVLEICWINEKKIAWNPDKSPKKVENV